MLIQISFYLKTVCLLHNTKNLELERYSINQFTNLDNYKDKQRKKKEFRSSIILIKDKFFN